MQERRAFPTGRELVRFCLEAGIEVTSLPGPAACITALTMSGLSTRRFCFEGFLPMDKKEREVVLERLQRETRTTVFYEAPHRLLKTLKALREAVGNRRLTICKELTKRHEKTWLTSLDEAIDWYETNEARGEYVLVFEGADAKALEEERQAAWETMSIEEHMAIYLSKGRQKRSNEIRCFRSGDDQTRGLSVFTSLGGDGDARTGGALYATDKMGLITVRDTVRLCNAGLLLDSKPCHFGHFNNRTLRNLFVMVINQIIHIPGEYITGFVFFQNNAFVIYKYFQGVPFADIESSPKFDRQGDTAQLI